jgi:hypothetical protein
MRHARGSRSRIGRVIGLVIATTTLAAVLLAEPGRVDAQLALNSGLGLKAHVDNPGQTPLRLEVIFLLLAGPFAFG